LLAVVVFAVTEVVTVVLQDITEVIAVMVEAVTEIGRASCRERVWS
jgi:hypothetical protein